MASSSSGPPELELNQVEPSLVGVARGPDGFERNGLRMRGREFGGRAEEEEEDEAYDGVQQEAPTVEERTWSKWVAIVSGIDVALSGGIFITSFSFAYRAEGASLWCMGIQATSHLLSSLMLVFRFAGESRLPSNTDDAAAAGLLRRQRRRFLLREQGVSIVMGLVMLISSAGLLFKAFRKIRFWDVWYQDHETMDNEAQWALQFLAWYGFSHYFLQAVFRCWAGCKLRRSIMWNAFVASVVSVLFLLVLGLAASYQKEWSWKAEPIAAIVLSFVCLAEGIRIVIMHLDDMDTRLRYDPRA